MQMLMTGEPLNAKEAYRLGMVNEIYPRSGLMPAVLRIANTIASNSPTAVQAVKRAVVLGSARPSSGQRDRDRPALALGSSSGPRRGQPGLS